jgi:hypothetical protein
MGASAASFTLRKACALAPYTPPPQDLPRPPGPTKDTCFGAHCGWHLSTAPWTGPRKWCRQRPCRRPPLTVRG